MTDNEKQFEDFVRDIKVDDAPDANHRDRLEPAITSRRGSEKCLYKRVRFLIIVTVSSNYWGRAVLGLSTVPGIQT